MIALGIDIGGTSIKAALLDGDREIWAGQSPAYARPSADEVLGALRAGLRGVPHGEAGASATPIRVGLCVPGVRADVPDGEATGAGDVIVRSANMPGLIGTPLVALVRAGLPSGIVIEGRVYMCSDAHAAAIDFATGRAVAGRLLAISLGTGVGAAVLDDGRLVMLTGASSGHFGQMDVTVTGIDPVPVGPDGGRGGLEGYIGLPALAARHGDPRAWLARLRGDEPELAALVRAIRIAHAIYRPNHVALLGGVGVRLRPWLAALRSAASDQLTSLARDGWELSCGESDHHAARGAARLAAAAP